MMRRSDYLLGRRATRAAFAEGETFTVSAYVFHGYGLPNMRYTDPVSRPPKATSRIAYRIRVTPKIGVVK